MVRSTILVRASDALPLAASVDDEQVFATSEAVRSPLDIWVDRVRTPRAEATGKAHLPSYHAEC